MGTTGIHNDSKTISDWKGQLSGANLENNFSNNKIKSDTRKYSSDSSIAVFRYRREFVSD